MKKKLNKLKIISLKKVKQKKGDIIKILTKEDSFFDSFGELYISEVKPHKIKAWRYHKNSTQNLFVIKGNCSVVCLIKNKFKKIELSENAPKLLIIPKKHWYGFKNKGSVNVKLLNFSSKIFSEKEILRKRMNEIKYNWKK